jgi:hypothetical protein
MVSKQKASRAVIGALAALTLVQLGMAAEDARDDAPSYSCAAGERSHRR